MKYYINQIKLDGYFTRDELLKIINYMTYGLECASLPEISSLSGFWGVKCTHGAKNALEAP